MYYSSRTQRFVVAAVSCFALAFSIQLSAFSQFLPAFPGAEGFGKYTSGGRGGQVVIVTTLEDDSLGVTEGSLRWAIKQYPGEPLTVCFAVTGEIRLVDRLYFDRREDFTLAGQTAPGAGIVITHNKVEFGGSKNFIVRNIRFRIGRYDIKGNKLEKNAVGAENCENFIFDHCEFGWSMEENFNTNDSHFFTVQYCIVHEGLYNAGHKKGARGYGCQWGGSPATYHHNLLVNNNARSCRFNGAQNQDYVVYLDYINNVQYNYGGGSTGCYGGENTAKLAEGEYNGLNSVHECNFVNNYYKPGPNTTNSTKLFFMSSYARSGATSWAPSKWYVAGNIMEGVDKINADNWQGVKSEKTYTPDELRVDTLIRTKTPWWRWTADSIYGKYDFESLAYAAGSFQTAAEAYQAVLDTVGTFPRDHVGSRLVADTKAGTFTYTGSTSGKKGIIDAEMDAEGFYAYTVVEPLKDTDQDGMPDAWEDVNGVDSKVPDNNYQHESGYTILEVYLDYAMKHKAPMDDGYVPQGIEITNYQLPTANKILRDGQLLIQRGGQTVTVQGQSVR